MTVRGGSAPQAVRASACSRGLHQGSWIYQELECTNGLGDLEYPIDKQGDCIVARQECIESQREHSSFFEGVMEIKNRAAAQPLSAPAFY
jgi:hypothetical protein